MALLIWEDSFSVGVPKIDDQHMVLIMMVNLLHEAIRENKGQDVLREIIDGMVAYAEIHFAVEELEMQRLDYPPYNQHKAQHDEFTRKARELQERLATGTQELPAEVINFLKDWLVNHIMTSDQALGVFIVRKGTSVN